MSARRARAGVLLLIAACAGAAGDGGGGAAVETPRPVVLELFTSEGCSSCPSADALLTRWQHRADLLPLSFHVDYWNSLGWIDPLARPAFSERQRQYRQSEGFELYTPQLVVDGRAAVAGSSQRDAERAIAIARSRVRSVDAQLTVDNGVLRVQIGAMPSIPWDPPLVALLLTYDERAEDDVPAGENAGRHLVSYNVVRSLRRLDGYAGKPFVSRVRLGEGETGHWAVLLLQDSLGTVWAATQVARGGNS